MLQHLKLLWRIAVGVKNRLDEANLSLVAAGGAFFSMLSMFPGMAAVITLLGFVADPALVEEQLTLVRDFIPDDAFAILQTQIRRMVETNSSTLGWATIIGISTALWSARKGTDALIRGINAIHHGPPRAGALALGLSFGAAVALSLTTVIALLALVVTPIVISILNLPVLVEVLPGWLMDWVNGALLFSARWSIALSVVCGSIWMLYRFSPNLPRRLHRLILPGLLIAVVLWGVATLGFSYYLSNFGNYSKVYGSIGAVIALLMFLYISIFVVLLGAAVNAVSEQELTGIDPANDTGPLESKRTGAVPVPATTEQIT